MEDFSDEWWARIEGIRHRVKSICFAADKEEVASIDAEMIELRDFIWAALRPGHHPGTATTASANGNHSKQ